MQVNTGYTPRGQFMGLHLRKQRWAIAVCHRRAGKTVACINDLIDASLRCRHKDPRYGYVAPLYSQAKDVAWNYLKQYTTPIPGVKINESELYVELPGGRRIRLYGADNYERLRGLYFDGLILDEYGDMDPRAWQEVLRATLADRQGWAVFIGTPRGLNHFAEAWQEAQGKESWFTLRLPASQTGLLLESELRDARNTMSEDQYLAEFECSFEASVVGSYWGREMQLAEKEKRIASVPYNPDLPVHTWWDLGITDAMAIWFTQDVGRSVAVIDHYENSGEGFQHYAKILNEKQYLYGTHNFPHDIKQPGSYEEPKTRFEIAQSLFGNRSCFIVPNVPQMDGIDKARSFIKRCWFDRDNTMKGRLALVSYQKKWDAQRKVFLAHPVHNWASHTADAFRYLAVGHKTAQIKERQLPEHRHPTIMEGEEATAWLGS